MKKKKLFCKALSIVLVFCLTLSVFPTFSVFADETEPTDTMWHSEGSNFNFEGDLPLDELETAELNPEETPEIVSEENIEKNKHVNRLWEQEKDLNTIVFQNRDGTKTSYLYSYAVKYKDKSGKIKDKKNKISETANGDYTNAENDINAYFPKKVHKNKGVELRFGEYVIEMAPNINGSSGACRQTGHDKYSNPTEYVQYPNVFEDGISLRYTPTFDGYKEDIILSKKPEKNRFEFKITTNGLSLVQAPTGNYYLAEPLTGDYITSLGNIVIYDNSGTESEGYNHYYEVTTLKENEQYLITVVVDKLYLEAETTVYPVCVDPTLTVMPKGYVENASLYSNKDETAAVGQIKIGYTPSYGTSRGLYNFPITDFENDFICMYGNQIVSAELNLYAVGYSEANDKYNVAKTLSLYEFNREWSPNTVKWSNTDANDYGTKITSKAVTKHWTAFNILPVINKFKTNSNYTVNFKGLLLKADSETMGVWKKMVSSSGTAANRPYITITYNNNPPACQQVVSGVAYYLKNYNDDYLDVYKNGTTSNTPLITYEFNGNTNQQFEITNIAGGEYEISPLNTNGMVLSVNSNKEVILEADSNASRQRWYIFYRNGKYHIVNKQYNTAVMAPKYDTEYVSINDEYGCCCWELKAIECLGALQPEGEKHADLHILRTIMDGTGFPYYECLGCDAIFMSPEEQDSEILTETDLITVFALYRAAFLKGIEGKDNQAEACLRAVDKIRTKYEGFYDYSYQNGKYKSPYSYEYDADNIDISIDIATNKYTMAEAIGEALLWNVNEVLPFPYNVAASAIKAEMDPNQEYCFADLFEFAIDIYTDSTSNPDIRNTFKMFKYVGQVVGVVNYTGAVISTIQSNSVNTGDTAVTIEFNGNTVYDRFIGYYNFYNYKVNILDERAYMENRNVTGITTNMFYQRYINCGNGYLYTDRTEILIY